MGETLRSSHETQSTPQLNPLDAAVAMSLAFWSYPHKDVEAAEKIAKYPTRGEHAEPGDDLPARL